MSFDQPARAALLPLLAPPEDLTNAISLQTLVFNAASIAGPPLGGAVAAVAGLAGDFALNGCSYLAVIVSLLLVAGARDCFGHRIAGFFANLVRRAGNVGGDPKEAGGLGGRVWSTPSCCSSRLPRHSWFRSLSPTFYTGARRSWAFCSRRRASARCWDRSLSPRSAITSGKGRLMVSANAAWVIALAIFALSRTFASSFVMLLLMAAAQSVFSTLVVTLMQGAWRPRCAAGS